VITPRPSRKARWTIGLSLVTIFALVACGATMVALFQLTANLPASDGYLDEITEADASLAELDSTALATVLDVDLYDADDEPIAQSEGPDEDGYVMVDVRFKDSLQALEWEVYDKDEEKSSHVVTMAWDQRNELPSVGDMIDIRYRSYDPEFAPQLGGPGNSDPDRAAAPPLAAASATGDVVTLGVPVRWTIAISSLLTLLTLIGTVIWARRAAPAEATTALGGRILLGGHLQSAPPHPHSYPHEVWPQPGWPQQALNYQYPQVDYSPTQYPPAQYAQAQFPQAQFPPAQFPPHPTQPPPPPGLTPPG
jgi:hypothetical protein